MVPFAGWDMPVSYPIGTVGEVRACRTNAGLFDVSHMGEVMVTGEGALAFLQYITTNNVAKLADGDAQYSMLLNLEAGVLDDIIVYRIAAENFIVVVNASCHDKDLAWIQDNAANFAVKIVDLSDLTALIAVQGPEAVAMVAKTTAAPIASLKRFQFLRAEEDGIPVLYSRTGYTGEDGFELFMPWENAPEIWQRFFELEAVPCGLGARDVLRLEAAYPLYGHELDEMHTPAESGTYWATKMLKGEFIGRSSLEKQLAAGVAETIVGIKMVDPPNSIPREGCALFLPDVEGPIGVVTSGTLSPMAGCGIAMARLRVEASTLGTDLLVDIRGRRVPARLVKLPFYRNGV